MFEEMDFLPADNLGNVDFYEMCMALELLDESEDFSDDEYEEW